MGNDNKLKTEGKKNSNPDEAYLEFRATTRRYVVTGAVWIFAGFILIGIAQYRGSGIRAHVVIWGAFLFGSVQFLRGMSRLKK